MKKQIMLVMIAVVIGVGSAFAQNQPRLTMDERIKTAMEKIVVLKLDTAATSKTQIIVSDFYSAQQKAMEEMRASGTMDRDAMMTKRRELADARDLKLKAIFSAAQFKSWTEEVEPALRPQRMQKSN